jgi:glycosyltransferase involved in cell wall biosynthesis
MIAVLLPTYNQAAFLPDALAGLAAQTRRDFELIACDDGSTDGTAGILAAHGVRTVTHPENRGTATAINSAAAQVSDAARYLTWVSSDNVMRPDWLARLSRVLDRRPDVGAAYSSYSRVQDGRAHGGAAGAVLAQGADPIGRLLRRPVVPDPPRGVAGAPGRNFSRPR